MHVLQLVMPGLTFLLYGLNTTLGRPRIELFMLIGWGLFAVGIVHSVCLIINPQGIVTTVLHFVVLAFLVIGGAWNFCVCIGQLRQDLGHTVRNFIMFACASVAIYTLIR